MSMLHHIMGCHTDVSRDCEWAVENGVNGATVLFKNLFGFLQSNLLLPGSAWGAVYLLKGRRSRRVREQLTSPGNAGARLCPNDVKLKGFQNLQSETQGHERCVCQPAMFLVKSITRSLQFHHV